MKDFRKKLLKAKIKFLKLVQHTQMKFNLVFGFKKNDEELKFKLK